MVTDGSDSTGSIDRTNEGAAAATSHISRSIWSDIASSQRPLAHSTEGSESGTGTLDFSTEDLYQPKDGRRSRRAEHAAPSRVPRPATRSLDAHPGPSSEARRERASSEVVSEPQTLSGRFESMEAQLRTRSGDHAADILRLTRIRESMHDFEQRAQRDHLDQAEITRTYQQISRLLDSTATQPTDAAQRLVLVDQLLRQSAHPTEVNQLSNNTTGLAAMESVTYSRFPSRAARLIADVATSGQYAPVDNMAPTIVEPAAIRPQGSSLNPDESRGDCSYASQIFQVTAVNLHLAQHGIQDRAGLPIRDGDGNRTSAGHVHYSFVVPEPGSQNAGERLVDDNGRELSDPISHRTLRAPDLSNDRLQELSRLISGSQEQPILSNAQYARGAGGSSAPGHSQDVVFASEQEFASRLSQLRSEGRLPVTVAINTQHQPFFDRLPVGQTGTAGGWRLVTVSDYDASSGRVSLVGHGTSSMDRTGDDSISLHSLYMSTLPPGSSEVIRELQDQEQHGSGFSARVEAQMHGLREQRNGGAITDFQYVTQMAQLYNDLQDRWRTEDYTITGSQSASSLLQMSRDWLRYTFERQLQLGAPELAQEIAARVNSPGDRELLRGLDSNGFVSRSAMWSRIQNIREATDGSMGQRGALQDLTGLRVAVDTARLNTLLENSNEAERRVMNIMFQQRYGMTLEQELRRSLDGGNLDRALNLLRRPDDEVDDAGRIHTALIERSQWVQGRPNAVVERDIRDTLATRNSDQITRLSQEYRARYGQTLEAALRADRNLSQPTREAVEVYLQGTDRRSAAQTQQLINIALRESDMTMFQEAFRAASADDRRTFMQNGGEQRMQAAFGPSRFRQIVEGGVSVLVPGGLAAVAAERALSDDAAVQHARDYANQGHLSVATQIRDNTSPLGDNEGAIERVLAQMAQAERDSYRRGRELVQSRSNQSQASASDRQAIAYYNDVHSALQAAGNASEMARWEGMIERPPTAARQEAPQPVASGGVPIDVLMARLGERPDSYRQVLAATPEERQRILNDRDFRDRVLRPIGPYQNDIALNVVRQGTVRPEDSIRASILAHGGGSEIVQVLQSLTPDQREAARREYSRKYRSDLVSDVSEYLSGQERVDAMRALRRSPVDSREAFNRARDEHYDSAGTFGRWFVDTFWDGTGQMSDSQLHQYAGELARHSAGFHDLPPARQRELEQNLQQSLALLRESRGAAADAFADALTAVAAVGGAAVTGGVSLTLLTATGIGGAALRIGARSAVMGSEYDFSRMAGRDAATGFVDAALGSIGPGEVAAVLRVGERAATAAATRIAAEGGEQLLRRGAQQSLERNITSLVRESIVNGSYRISDQAVDSLVAQAAREGLDQAGQSQLRNLVRSSLTESIESESRSMLRRLGTQYGLNMAGGATGGAGSGLVRGVADWDSQRSVSENLAAVARSTGTSAAFGAGGAAAFTTLSVAGRGASRALSRERAPQEAGRPASGSGSERPPSHVAGAASEAHAGANPRAATDAHPGSFDQPRLSLAPDVANARPGAGGQLRAEVSTAPRQVLTVDGHPVSSGREQILGRAGDVPLSNPTVSARHVSIRSEANGDTFIRDLASTNGTYVNGQRITPAQGEVRLNAGDRVHLGTHEITFGWQPQSRYTIRVGDQSLNLHPGQELPVARRQDGSGNGAHSTRIGMDQHGIYVVEDAAHPSADGTFVNGSRIPSGQRVYLRSSDEVMFGNAHGSQQGQWLQLLPTEVRRVPNGQIPSDAAAFQRAIDSSNNYARSQEMPDRIPDGWQNGGIFNEFRPDGSFANSSVERIATVVDRQNDATLRQVIEEARQRFGQLPPRERANALTSYVRDLMMPQGVTQRGLDAWYSAFNRTHAGERIYLGEFIRMGRGVCSQQATLLQVLSQELGLPATLVRGAGEVGRPQLINHAWVHMQLPGESAPLIFDPRNGISGIRYGELAQYVRGADIVAQAAPVPPLRRQFAVAQAEAVINGSPVEIGTNEVQIGRAHGNIDAASLQSGYVSADHAVLRRGPDGTLYVRDTSRHGTWVNGQRIPAGEDWPLAPTDQIRLGAPDGPELRLQERPQPPADVYSGDRRLDVAAGQEIPVGRRHAGLDAGSAGYDLVSADHAFLGRGADGRMYVRDESRNGTYVNGRRLPPSQNFPVGPGDNVRLGSPDGPGFTMRNREGAQGQASDSPAGAGAHAGAQRRVIFANEQWDVAGFDPDTGDAILWQHGRGRSFVTSFREVTAAELARDFREIPVGNHTYYRDGGGHLFELAQGRNGQQILVTNHEFRAVPRAQMRSVPGGSI